ncbi:exported hypothetical protein [Cupriavidus oxalaticus]|uniref:Uncharacterized protein n=1 Tax=Cupriavidus oxalaticus TaxID=96344 RepID=A0A375FTU5_9BURK|nr:exported hypothetical protein [Cupriavidus oxalaticus]SPC10554.1 exported hypothetical protein [Cupriavidus oxalaticus]
MRGSSQAPAAMAATSNQAAAALAAGRACRQARMMAPFRSLASVTAMQAMTVARTERDKVQLPTPRTLPFVSRDVDSASRARWHLRAIPSA